METKIGPMVFNNRLMELRLVLMRSRSSLLTERVVQIKTGQEPGRRLTNH